MEANYEKEKLQRTLQKRILSKCERLFKSYDPIQNAYADILEANPNIDTIHCNVELEGHDYEDYTTDFVCELSNGDLMVWECVHRSLLTKPLTMKLLDLSFTYWKNRGVKDWGLVVDETTEE